MTGQGEVFSQIGDALRSHERFLVCSHYRPDGDAVGSQIALASCLAHMNKSVATWNHDEVPHRFRFLAGSHEIVQPPPTPSLFDVVVALDTSDFDRLGDIPKRVKKPALWINIDHHKSNNGYGDIACIDANSPATGQILYELILDQNLPLTPKAADALFAAIATDTGGFQYSGTTARTFEIAADLVKAGVDVGELSRRVYQNYPYRRLALLRELLNAMEMTCDDRVVSVALTRVMVARAESKAEDTDGLIDHLRSIEGTVVAVFFEEVSADETRISMRSKHPAVDVCDICRQFGGGGHPMAAGARVNAPLSDTRKRVLTATAKAVRIALDNQTTSACPP